MQLQKARCKLHRNRKCTKNSGLLLKVILNPFLFFGGGVSLLGFCFLQRAKEGHFPAILEFSFSVLLPRSPFFKIHFIFLVFFVFIFVFPFKIPSLVFSFSSSTTFERTLLLFPFFALAFILTACKFHLKLTVSTGRITSIMNFGTKSVEECLNNSESDFQSVHRMSVILNFHILQKLLTADII